MRSPDSSSTCELRSVCIITVLDHILDACAPPPPPLDLHTFPHVSVLYACYLKCKGDTVFPQSALDLCPTVHLLIKVKPCHTCGHVHKEHVSTAAVIAVAPCFFFFFLFIVSPSFLSPDNERLSVRCSTQGFNLHPGLFLC